MIIEDTLVCILAQNPMVIYSQSFAQVNAGQQTHLTNDMRLIYSFKRSFNKIIVNIWCKAVNKALWEETAAEYLVSSQ